jgi:light-regulated signal transduction histidine kinase (bacteriophytochrome)
MPTVQNGISFYTPESRKIIEQAVQQAIAHGKPFNLELQIATAKGNIRSVRAIGEPNLANREVQGFFQDITERKKAEEALRIVTENLKRSNLELEQFAYVASHDLQEPLRMVTSYTQLIEQRYKGKLDADADEFIGYAVDGANRMRRLIDDLLSYSRVTRRGNPFKPTESQLALDVALKNLQMLIEENGAVVTHDQLPEVMADEGQLVQILQNLISNAIKFHSKETPRVHVSAKHLQEAEYLFSVQDNGIGIDPQYFDRLFKIFQRLHTKEEYPGTGIGLALCKRIVERHGGRIWLESQPGKGTTTYFTLNNKNGAKQEI